MPDDGYRYDSIRTHLSINLGDVKQRPSEKISGDRRHLGEMSAVHEVSLLDLITARRWSFRKRSCHSGLAKQCRFFLATDAQCVCVFFLK